MNMTYCVCIYVNQCYDSVITQHYYTGLFFLNNAYGIVVPGEFLLLFPVFLLFCEIIFVGSFTVLPILVLAIESPLTPLVLRREMGRCWLIRVKLQKSVYSIHLQHWCPLG